MKWRSEPGLLKSPWSGLLFCAAILVFGVFLARSRHRQDEALMIADCLQLYRTAHSQADTLRADRTLVPIKPFPKGRQTECILLRRGGKLGL